MVRASAVFVVADGGLRGMISRDRLLDSLKSSTADRAAALRGTGTYPHMDDQIE